MLSIKLVRSLVLGETITTTTTLHEDNININNEIEDSKKVKKKKLPMLLFLPTKELITDTFRLASICRHLGMNFYPSPSLSHLLFSWPNPNITINSNNNNNFNFNINNNNRNSVSSQTSSFTQTSMASSSSTVTSSSSMLLNDAVPIPFPTLSTSSSISLLRSFISLSKGFFKLVFIDPNPNLNPSFVDYDTIVEFGLFSRVSGKRVKSIDELSMELARKGWSLYRSKGDLVYLFRKTEGNRVRVRIGGGGEGGSRVRELRLGKLDFEKGINFRVLLYILLITDDVFYLA